MGEQQRTMPAARYAAPAAALIALLCRSDRTIDQSQIDPFETAEPESSLRSAPF